MSQPVQDLIDFNVTRIMHIIERFPDKAWRVDRAVYPEKESDANMTSTDPGKSSTPMTNKGYYILAYALSGSAHYNINGRSYNINQNDLIFIKEDSVRTAYSNPQNPWHFYSLSFCLQFNSEESRQFVNQLPDVITGHTLKLLPVLMDEANRSWVGKRTGYLIQCRGLIMQALYLLICSKAYSQNSLAHYEHVERVISVLQGNYVSNYTNEQLAKMANLSCSHFRALFRSITGMSPINYHIQMKMNKAQSLLLTGHYSVSQVAALLGFKDIYYFSRMFKKYTGISPSAYRKSSTDSSL